MEPGLGAPAVNYACGRRQLGCPALGLWSVTGDGPALAEACGDYGTLVHVLAYTGLHWGEATALRVRRVDLHRRRLNVVEAASEHSGRITIGTPKSHQQRQVPFPAFLAGELATLLRARQADDLVFTARPGGPCEMATSGVTSTTPLRQKSV